MGTTDNQRHQQIDVQDGHAEVIEHDQRDGDQRYAEDYERKIPPLVTQPRAGLET